jgi:hypothetical protein
MPKLIQVTFKDGQAEIVTSGFIGGDCLKETRELKEELGGDVKSQRPTAEMQQGQKQNQGLKAKG